MHGFQDTNFSNFCCGHVQTGLDQGAYLQVLQPC